MNNGNFKPNLQYFLFISCFLLLLLLFVFLCTVLLTIMFLVTYFLSHPEFVNFYLGNRNENSAQRGELARGKSKKQKAKSTL